MLKYLIQVIQNLLIPAILVALLSALADKSGGEQRKGRLFFCCCGGSAAALILAILRRTTRLVNREFVNTGVLSAAILCAVLFMALLWGFRKKPELREKLMGWAHPALPALLLFYALPTILLYPPEFLLAGQSVFSTDFLYKLVGFLAGLLVAVLGALALFETAGGLSLFTVKLVLSAALAVNMVSQVSVILQFLLARRLISVPRRVFRIMVRIINHYDVFLYIILALSAVVPLAALVKSFRPAGTGRNPAEARKFRAGRRNRRRWIAVAFCGYAAAVLSLTVIKQYNERGVVLTPAEPMTIIENEIVIPIEKIADGHLHRYNYTAADNIEMRFIVIKKNEIAYGVGLDACDICGPTGYYERKDEVICRLCDVVMNISTIGFKGGCNPVPLAYTLRSGNMVIDTEDLEKERTRFK
ncbi:MAG: DUF2318 domain-containing protein [Treponema sp.]|jgi:uncharacterized membrane protein|nr:DUF2318 domain-containing protein [Treponema sp.]